MGTLYDDYARAGAAFRNFLIVLFDELGVIRFMNWLERKLKKK